MIRLLTGLFPLPQAAARRCRPGSPASTRRGDGAGAGHRRFLPRDRPEQCHRRRVQRRRPAAGRVHLAVRAGGDAASAEQGRRTLVGLFEAIADALLVIIGWVLWIAPLGVFALAFTVGASAGGAAFAGARSIISSWSRRIGVLVTLAGYPIAILAGRLGARRPSPGR